MPGHDGGYHLLTVSYFGVFISTDREVGAARFELTQCFEDNRIGLVDDFEIAVESEDVARYQCFDLIHNQRCRNVDVVSSRSDSSLGIGIVDERLEQDVVGRQARQHVGSILAFV